MTFEDKARIAVLAFLRLRIPSYEKEAPNSSPYQGEVAKGRRGSNLLYKLIPEIKNCAFVRELHTYGQLLSIGTRDETASQHKGLGKKLLAEAEKIAQKNGFNKIAVISGVGARDYYRKNGYSKIGTYMIKSI